jgi:hypothetical protein
MENRGGEGKLEGRVHYNNDSGEIDSRKKKLRKQDTCVGLLGKQIIDAKKLWFW